MYQFVIKGNLPSMNDIVKYAKSGYKVYAKIKKAYTYMVFCSCLNLYRKIGTIKKPIDVEITWFCPDKKSDPDNIMAGQKFIFDGMQKAGLIKNDGWNNINSISHKFGVDKKCQRIEVNIKEVVI